MGGLPLTREVILAKVETTYNTDPTPSAGSNAILVRNLNVQNEGLRMIDREAIRSSIGQLQKIFGGGMKKITFECEVKGSGSAGTAPEIAPLLKACAMAETTSAATSVTYKPTSSSHSSVTIYFFEGGRKRNILTGCRGNVTFRADAGGILLAQFEFTGHISTVTDQSQPNPSYSSQVPVALVNLSVSVNGVTSIVTKSWSWGLNNKIAMPASMAATDGYGEVLVTGRDVAGEIEIESELVATLDERSLLTAGTKFAFSSGAIGDTAGNRVTVTTPSSSTYVTDTQISAADGVRNVRLLLAVDDSTSDQELSVVFT